MPGKGWWESVQILCSQEAGKPFFRKEHLPVTHGRNKTLSILWLCPNEWTRSFKCSQHLATTLQAPGTQNVSPQIFLLTSVASLFLFILFGCISLASWQLVNVASLLSLCPIQFQVPVFYMVNGFESLDIARYRCYHCPSLYIYHFHLDSPPASYFVSLWLDLTFYHTSCSQLFIALQWLSKAHTLSITWPCRMPSFLRAIGICLYPLHCSAAKLRLVILACHAVPQGAGSCHPCSRVPLLSQTSVVLTGPSVSAQTSSPAQTSPWFFFLSNMHTRSGSLTTVLYVTIDFLDGSTCLGHFLCPVPHTSSDKGWHVINNWICSLKEQWIDFKRRHKGEMQVLYLFYKILFSLWLYLYSILLHLISQLHKNNENYYKLYGYPF